MFLLMIFAILIVSLILAASGPALDLPLWDESDQPHCCYDVYGVEL